MFKFLVFGVILWHNVGENSALPTEFAKTVEIRFGASNSEPAIEETLSKDGKYSGAVQIFFNIFHDTPRCLNAKGLNDHEKALVQTNVDNHDNDMGLNVVNDNYEISNNKDSDDDQEILEPKNFDDHQEILKQPDHDRYNDLDFKAYDDDYDILSDMFLRDDPEILKQKNFDDDQEILEQKDLDDHRESLEHKDLDDHPESLELKDLDDHRESLEQKDPDDHEEKAEESNSDVHLKPWGWWEQFDNQNIYDQDEITYDNGVWGMVIDNTPADQNSKSRSNRSFKLHTELLSWNEARKACHKDGGNLVVVRSDDEESDLIKMMETADIEGAWIGVHNMYDDKEWVSVFDEPLEKTGWFKWSPLFALLNTAPNDKECHCAQLLVGGGMTDQFCNIHRPFICNVS